MCYSNKINNTINLEEHLNNFNNWNEEIAIKLAESEGIKLELIHWDIIRFVRIFYQEYKMFPKIRTILQMVSLKHGIEKGNSRYLLKLFSKQSIVQQIAKIAGLPKPNKCV